MVDRAAYRVARLSTVHTHLEGRILSKECASLAALARTGSCALNTDRFVLIYAGGLAESRGIFELIEAVGRLEGAAELWLPGLWFSEDCRPQPRHAPRLAAQPLVQ